MELIPNPFYIKTAPSNPIIGNNITGFVVGLVIPNKFTFYKIYSGGSSNSYGGIKK